MNQHINNNNADCGIAYDGFGEYYSPWSSILIVYQYIYFKIIVRELGRRTVHPPGLYTRLNLIRINLSQFTGNLLRSH